MDPKRSDELLAGSVSDTEAHGLALFSILYQLEQISAKLEVIAGQSQPLTLPPVPVVNQGGGDEDTSAEWVIGDQDDFDEDTPPDGVEDNDPALAHDPDTGQFVADDPDTPEDEHYEKPDGEPPGVAS
jgi:hypothetical protein